MATQISASASPFLLEDGASVFLSTPAIVIKGEALFDRVSGLALRKDELVLKDDRLLVLSATEEPFEIFFAPDQNLYVAENLTNSPRAVDLDRFLEQLRSIITPASIDDVTSAALSDQGALVTQQNDGNKSSPLEDQIDAALSFLTQNSLVLQDSFELIHEVYLLLDISLEHMEEDAQLLIDAADIAVNQIQDVQSQWQRTPSKVSLSTVVATAILLVGFEFAIFIAAGAVIHRGLLAWKRVKVTSVLDSRLTKRLARLAGLKKKVEYLAKETSKTISLRDATARHLAEAQVLVRAARYSSKHTDVIRSISSKIHIGKTTDAAKLKKILDDALAQERKLLFDKKMLDSATKELEKSLKEANSRFRKAALRPRVSTKEVEKLIGDGSVAAMIPTIAKLTGSTAKETAKGIGAMPKESGATEPNSDIGDSISTVFRIQILKLHRSTQREALAMRRDLRELYNLAQLEEAAIPAVINGFAQLSRNIINPLLDAAVRESSLRDLALDFEFSIWALTLPDLKLVPEDSYVNIFLPEGTVKVSTPGVLDKVGYFLGELLNEPPREFEIEGGPSVPGINFFVPGLKNQMLDYFSKRFSRMLGIKAIGGATGNNATEAENNRRLVFVALFADALRDRRKQIEKLGSEKLEKVKTADKDVIKVEVNSMIYGSFALVKNTKTEPPSNL